MSQIRNVAILGSTGSIGRAALDVLSHLGDHFHVAGISCHQQIELLETQIGAFMPSFAFATGPIDDSIAAWQNQSVSGVPQGTIRQRGMDALVSFVQSDEVDIVVAAIVGIAGLESSLAAAKAGKRLALANKESLVVSGSLMMEAARANGSEI